MNAFTPVAGLTLTSKGQVTFKKDLLQHLGVEAGEQIEVMKLPNGEMKIRAKRPKGDISAVFGMFKDKVQKPLSIDEMNEVIAKGWAGLL